MAEAFSNTTVVLCRPGDLQLARANWPETGGFEQDDDGPVKIVMGTLTSDDTCGKLGERFGVESYRLRKFRDTPELKTVMIVDAKGARHGSRQILGWPAGYLDERWPRVPKHSYRAA